MLGTGTAQVTQSIDALINQSRVKTRTPEYVAKMLHKIPKATVIDRVGLILGLSKDKVVLNIGCASGEIHSGINDLAKKVYGIDKEPCKFENFVQLDLDDIQGKIPVWADVELVVCGEVLEHLGNPGWFLQRLKAAYPDCLKFFSVPNALSSVGQRHAKQGHENVNKDHVAYYSYRTLLTLMERYGYSLRKFYFYTGEPIVAEGLIFLVR